MRLVVQAVERAEVKFESLEIGDQSSEKINSIGKGIVIYFGVHKDDVIDAIYKIQVASIIDKIRNMRWLKDDAGRLDATLDAVGGEIMVISNFTLYAKNKKGNKMSFSDSASASDAEPIYDYFVQGLRDT